MRTTVIPAQVTTVEDTIAGNLNLTQIVLLVSSLFVNTAIYALVPKQLSFSPLKTVLMIAVFIVFVGLTLRIKGRVVINWLVILLSYLARPHLYLFNKNDSTFRDMSVYVPSKKELEKSEVVVKKSRSSEQSQFDLQSLLRNTDVNVRFTKKGLSLVKN